MSEKETLIRCIRADATLILSPKYQKEEYSTFECAAHLVAKRALKLIELDVALSPSPERPGLRKALEQIVSFGEENAPHRNLADCIAIAKLALMLSPERQTMTDEEARELLRSTADIPNLHDYLRLTHQMWPFDWAIAAIKRASSGEGK